MFLEWNHRSIRLTGRWDRSINTQTSTTTNGSRIEAAFAGKSAIIHFDISTNVLPFPHLWITVDEGPKVEVPLARLLHVESSNDGPHSLQIIMKSSSEGLARWFYPQEAVVRFKGLEVDSPSELRVDTRLILEVIGDSITEGVLVEVANTDEGNYHERVFQDDTCSTYAWKCAERLNMRPRPIGFGAVGTLKSGSGEVPNVLDSYGFIFDGCPCEEEKADVIVIAHGTNDWGRTDEEFAPAYTGFLEIVRQHNPKAVICAMSPFVGRFEEMLPGVVDQYNQTHSDNVKFISTKGWLPVEPVHPLKAGHARAGELLAKALIEVGAVSHLL